MARSEIPGDIPHPLTLLENPRTLPVVTWTDLRRLHDRRRSLLVTSPRAYEQFKPFASGLHIVDQLEVTSAHKTYVDGLIARRLSVESIYAVGGGRVLDVARLIATHWQVDIAAIPTIISTDAPFVDSTGVRTDGTVRYLPTKVADRVLLDENLLRAAPAKYHAGGCCDVLSIYTALSDWRLSNDRGVAKPNEVWDIQVATQAQLILDYLFEHQNDLAVMSRKGLEALVQALCMEVELCNRYGNSRSEEGGEHYFAYALESQVPHAVHGELVGLGLLLTAFLQGQPWEPVKTFMDAIGMPYLPNGITPDIVESTLRDLPKFVREHNHRYSIFNEYVHDEAKIAKFLPLIGLKEHDGS